MRLRHRESSGKVRVTYYGEDYSYDAATTTEDCLDFNSGKTTVNPLDLQKVSLESGLVSTSPFPGAHVSGPPENAVSLGVSYKDGEPMVNQHYTNKLLAQGPHKPVVSLPLYIFEMRDIPRMIRHAGDLLHKIRRPSGLDPLKEAASANLAYNFGWKPLLEDLFKALDFQKQMDKRRERLLRTTSSDGLRTRVTLDSSSDIERGSAPIHTSWGVDLTLPYTETRSYETWATCRWYANASVDLDSMLFEPNLWNAAYGFRGRAIPITVWKALPWSWMIDWFVNVSDMLQATDNLIDFTPEFGAVMRTHETTRTYDFHPVLKEQCVVKGTRKTRAALPLNSGIPLPKLPIMDDFRAGILSSLLVTRLSR